MREFWFIDRSEMVMHRHGGSMLAVPSLSIRFAISRRGRILHGGGFAGHVFDIW